MELKQLLLDSVLISSIILGLLSLVTLSRLIGSEKYIGFYAIMISFFEWFAHIMVKVFQTSNLGGLHLYTLLEFILLSLFFYNLFKKFRITIPIKWIIGIGSAAIIANTIFLQSFNVMPSNSRTAVDFLIIAFCLFFYILLIKNLDEKRKFKPAIYFVTAIFIKSSLSSVIYLFSNSIMKMQPALRDQLWCFRVFINIVAIVLILISLLIILKKGKNDTTNISTINDSN